MSNPNVTMSSIYPNLGRTIPTADQTVADSEENALYNDKVANVKVGNGTQQVKVNKSTIFGAVLLIAVTLLLIHFIGE